jgi:hypothetical protein
MNLYPIKGQTMFACRLKPAIRLAFLCHIPTGGSIASRPVSCHCILIVSYGAVPFERFIETFFAYTAWRIPLKAGLEQALDLSKNVLDQAKRDWGDSPLSPCYHSVKSYQ